MSRIWSEWGGYEEDVGDFAPLAEDDGDVAFVHFVVEVGYADVG